jgi:hypothetical protein
MEVSDQLDVPAALPTVLTGAPEQVRTVCRRCKSRAPAGHADGCPLEALSCLTELPSVPCVVTARTDLDWSSWRSHSAVTENPGVLGPNAVSSGKFPDVSNIPDAFIFKSFTMHEYKALGCFETSGNKPSDATSHIRRPAPSVLDWFLSTMRQPRLTGHTYVLQQSLHATLHTPADWLDTRTPYSKVCTPLCTPLSYVVECKQRDEALTFLLDLNTLHLKTLLAPSRAM